MLLDPKACYRVITSRDRRFEGRFVVAVATTGIYCRPGCPARIPKRTNCRFFGCPAAAEAGGFRACKRCRPDASPETPAWNGTSTTVARAMRLIGTGAADGDGLETLASRLGVGTRHLRRLFAEHLGASPIALAQTRRVHFARRLLEETPLSMAEVAECSGFGSVRRFNDAFRASFAMTPRDVRRTVRPSASGLTLRLPCKPPFDFEGVLGWLGPRGMPGIERVQDGAWSRTFRIGKAAGVLSVREAGEGPSLEVRAPLPLDLLAIVSRVRRVFDLGADPAQIGVHLGKDRLLAPLVRKNPGLRLPGAWDGFEIAVRAILGQQISVAAATTMAGRLAAEYGDALPRPEPGLERLFPTPEQLASFAPRWLPRARSAAIRGVAQAVVDGRVDLEASRGLDETVARLRELPGIGEWTAQYIAMRALGEVDAFPAGDLGLRKALGKRGIPAAEKDVLLRSERWRPWRAYAAIHLWRTL